MIELAPFHKIGLALPGPVMIASGCGGYGDVVRRLVNLSAFGALVTNPITLGPRRGPGQPRLAETKAGFVLDTGLQNPGVRKVLRQHSKSWPRLGVPVIAHLPADEPDDLRRTARALAGTGSIAAVELGVPAGAGCGDVERWLRAVAQDCSLPVLVKLPLDAAVDLAEAAAAASADALVIGQPPPGAAIPRAGGEPVDGYLYGPALHSLVLPLVRAIGAQVDLPLVAAGGIHSLADTQTLLQAGAVAVQLDTLLFVDPQQAETIAETINRPDAASI